MKADTITGPVESGRARLLAAAHDLFPVEGFSGSSVASILAKSRLQAPSLYHHFGDKEGLYMAWLEESIRDLGLKLRTRIAEAEGFEAKLAAAAGALMDLRSPDILLLRRDAAELKSDLNSQTLHARVTEEVYEPLMTLFVSQNQTDLNDLERLVDAFVIGSSGLTRVYAMRPHPPTTETSHWWAHQFIHGAMSKFVRNAGAVSLLLGAVS